VNFFNIGAGEFFLILILAMLIFGPQRLPELARKAGKAVRDLRNWVNSIDPELLEDFRELTRDLDTVRSEMANIRADMADIQRDLAGAARDLSTSVNEAVSSINRPQAGSTGATFSTPPALSASTVATAAVTSSVAASAPAGAPSSATAPASSATPYAGAAASQSSPVAGIAVGEELLGQKILLGPDGKRQWDEILGRKTFPLPRRAAAARPLLSVDGHRGTSLRPAQLARRLRLRPQAARRLAVASRHVRRPLHRRLMRG
jgi:sec-independent protein translocase protein TatB